MEIRIPLTITVSVEQGGRASATSPYVERPSFARQEEERPRPAALEEPHNPSGPCYCPYCWSGM